MRDESWSTDLYVNAYFDTTSRKLSSSQLCTDASINNCNDLIKFYDDTVWNFQSGMTIKFDNPNSRCIRLKSSSSNYRIEGGSCHEWKRFILDQIQLKWYWNHGGFVMFYALHPIRQTR